MNFRISGSYVFIYFSRIFEVTATVIDSPSVVGFMTKFVCSFAFKFLNCINCNCIILNYKTSHGIVDICSPKTAKILGVPTMNLLLYFIHIFLNVNAYLEHF
uniref:Uncharacterized protein n=1 Tax=Panstrongylus lignarius TaxID=156445 RepID=A0A224Y2T9_9HEMI